ncbi:MAG: hypothetical protein IJ532_08610 [Alphaproteobacteria bacterium]|nr:hypothetical protein [Alphaproteobacteria bacterium]
MVKKIPETALTLIKVIFKLCILLLAIFGVINLLPSTDETFDGIDLCADDGGVWDKEYNLCRFDCQYTSNCIKNQAINQKCYDKFKTEQLE